MGDIIPKKKLIIILKSNSLICIVLLLFWLWSTKFEVPILTTYLAPDFSLSQCAKRWKIL